MPKYGRLSRRNALIAALVMMGAACSSPQRTPSIKEEDRLSPAEAQLTWLLGALEPEGARDGKALSPHFTPAFLEQVPADKLAAIFDSQAEQGPFALTCLDLRSEHMAVAYLHSDTTDLAITLAANAAQPEQLETLFFQSMALPSVESWEDFEQTLREVAPTVSFSAAELTSEGPRTVAAVDPTQSVAIASAFKLWVLLALAEEIEAGSRSWEDTLFIREDHRVLSSLALDEHADGEALTLEALAAAMIQLSDNTATDILIEALGRERVEAAMRSTGIAHPERNIPLLKLADFFSLKLLMTPEQRRAYFAADASGRRAMLDAGLGWSPSAATLVLVMNGGWKKPMGIDKAEWFATSHDMILTLAALEPFLDRDPILARVLQSQTAFALCPGWKYNGYKGGNEPGVYHAAFLLETDDGQRYAVSLGLNDPTQPIAEADFIGIVSAAINHVHP